MLSVASAHKFLEIQISRDSQVESYLCNGRDARCHLAKSVASDLREAGHPISSSTLLFTVAVAIRRGKDYYWNCMNESMKRIFSVSVCISFLHGLFMFLDMGQTQLGMNGALHSVAEH